MNVMGTGWSGPPPAAGAATLPEQQTFELQVFDGRQYQTTLASDDRRALETPFERMTHRIRRIVLRSKARPAKPVYRRPPTVNKPTLDGAATVAAYLDWAQAHGVPRVTVYGDGVGMGRLGRSMARRWGDAVRVVRVADFLGPAPEAELDYAEAA